MKRTKPRVVLARTFETNALRNEIDEVDTSPYLIAIVIQLTLLLACRDHDSGDHVRSLSSKLGQSEGDPASGKESDGEVATSEIVAIGLVRRSVLVHHGLERVSESDTTLGRDVLVNKTNCFDLKDSVELVNNE